MVGKLVLITNRKSHMSFRLVPKSVTVNDLERRNGRYFAIFQRNQWLSGRTVLRKSGWRYTQTFCDRNVTQKFKFLAMYHLRWYDVGNSSIGGLNARGVAKYSDFRPIECYISEMVPVGGKLVLITNRKPYMGFRFVPKSVTLNDLERRNGPYFALFHRIHVRCRRKPITSVSKSTFDSLWPY